MRMEIQRIAEAILQKHGIDPAANEFYLKLSMPGFDDLVIERAGDQIFIGHYHEQNCDLVSDPVLVMDYNEGYWYPVRIEQVFGDTVCSYLENGKRMIYPARMKEFKAFQRMFAVNIKEQGWMNADEAELMI